MELNEIVKIEGNKRASKRVGRGIGSGKGGHTTGKGAKGQKARKGRKPWAGFEGGQVPLFKRMPKIGGFNNKKNAVKVIDVSLFKLNAFEDGAEVTPAMLVKAGIIKILPTRCEIKILGNGDITKKLTLVGFLYSESAKAKLEKAGSTIK
jgi:large subunit ribosomal protein L15